MNRQQIAGRESARVAAQRSAERGRLKRNYEITAREAWRVLIADPTDDNRAVFVAACERAR